MELALYHYYEADLGPFRNLSLLAEDEAERIMNRLKEEGNTFAAKRPPEYMTIRRELETKARAMFAIKGGKPQLAAPHYMTLGACDWLGSWYKKGLFVRIPLEAFEPEAVSFTYGDLFPTMRFLDGREYRGQVYNQSEILELIERKGWPQEWNRDGSGGPERYIEAQIWDERPLLAYLT